MMRIGALMLSVVAALGQATDHLTENEVAAALAAKPGSGAVMLWDRNYLSSFGCTAQLPTEFIYTPAGWLNSELANAKKQFLSYTPTESDTRRLLTIVSYGCAGGTSAGPVCQSISRVALMSDAHGATVVEAVENSPLAQSWHNGFGAQAACTNLVSKFSMADLARVRNSKGEFIVAAFGGSGLLKMYTVKEKHLKALGL